MSEVLYGSKIFENTNTQTKGWFLKVKSTFIQVGKPEGEVSKNKKAGDYRETFISL